MSDDLKYFLEGACHVVYFYHPGGRNDPWLFWETLPKPVRFSLLGTLQAFADHGKTPGKSSGHPECWYHHTPPPGCLRVELFKFKDDPTIRFYAVIYKTDGENRVVITYGFKDPKKGRQRDKKTETGKATCKAEEITLNYILMLSSQ